MRILGSAARCYVFSVLIPSLALAGALLCHNHVALAQDNPEKVEQAPLGSTDNPVRCHNPNGERYYLARLVDPQGREIDYGRMGSFGAGPNGNILDGYAVTVGDKKLEVYMDMYHPGYYEERPIPGFYLRCRMSWDLVIRGDGLRYAIGADKPYDGGYTTKDKETGKVTASVSLRKGVLEGVATRFHKNGAVRSLTPFEKGAEQGIAQYFNEKDTRTATITFDKGRRQGLATWYFEDGTIESQAHYKDGQLHGPWSENYPNGKPKTVGQRDGEWIYYNQDGTINRREQFKDGKRAKTKKQDEN